MASKRTDEKRLTAKELIAEANQRAAQWLPDEWLLGELEKLRNARNAGVPVRYESALKLLNDNGWKCGRGKFNRLLRAHYGTNWEAWGRE